MMKRVKFFFALLSLFSLTVVSDMRAASVNVTSIRLEHNVRVDDIAGFNVVLNFLVKDCVNQQAVVDVYLYDAAGNPITAPNSSFDDVGNGLVTKRMLLNPQYDTSYYNDYRIFFPYACLVNKPSGQYQVRAAFFVKEPSNGYLLSYKTKSQTAWFNFNKGGAAPQQQQQVAANDPMALLRDVMANPQAHMKFDFSNMPTQSVAPAQGNTSPSNAKQRCLACHGSGRIEKHLYTPGGGFFYCSECNQNRPNGHYHSNCPGCYGTGWLGGGF